MGESFVGREMRTEGRKAEREENMVREEDKITPVGSYE
jgi:hypothetical protein